ncbi:hypothetical protein INS49_015285 [Diaporthe citri]|uniref:uncharacterized protein n=1 Tax=Diaporthe citri TaxID=83186 RepID=UPI001C81535A|nr:uncharacterized protein INS49_015285 [Diaporthe citri]KAG6355901.1 hypothetical protein INS49_015285 [Diaporthe citri]
MDIHQTGDLLPFEASGWDSAPLQSRRKVPAPMPLEIRSAKTTRPPLSLTTGPIDNTRSPQYESPYERLPHSAYTYDTFSSRSPKFLRDAERRNGTWAVPQRANVLPAILRDDNPRCNVLYVSNLPMETSEDELESISSSQPGYRRMSLRARANGPSCFVEFDDVTSAAKALRNLYGWPLKNSKMGGIHLSFSKEPLGIQPLQVSAPRAPRRAPPPPPPPLILPGRSSSHSASRFASTGSAPMIAAPEPPRPDIEIESVSSPSIAESAPILREDKSDKENPHAEEETELRSHSQGDQDHALDDLAMSIVRGPDYKTEPFDEIRLWLERALEMELDWYPLPPIKQPVRLSQSRLVWTPMSVYLNEDETQRCSGYLEDVHGRPRANKPMLRSGNPAIVYARKASSFAAAWARILALSWQSPGSLRNSRSHNTPDDSDTARRLESHLCIEKHPSSKHDTELLTLRFLERMQDDSELFVQARRILGEAQGSWIRQLLPWSYHRDVLARFRFPSSNSGKVEETDISSLPDLRDFCGGYEYKCPEGAAIDIHMRVYAHILLEGFRYPEIGRGSRTLLDGIPKLRTPVGVEKEALNYLIGSKAPVQPINSPFRIGDAAALVKY